MEETFPCPQRLCDSLLTGPRGAAPWATANESQQETGADAPGGGGPTALIQRLPGRLLVFRSKAFLMVSRQKVEPTFPVATRLLRTRRA